MKPIKYTLNIYDPHNIRFVIGKYESSSPFVAIHEGDYLHPFPDPEGEGGWPELGPGKYLRATEVHHFLYDSESKEEITQEINVYTEVHDLG